MYPSGSLFWTGCSQLQKKKWKERLVFESFILKDWIHSVKGAYLELIIVIRGVIQGENEENLQGETDHLIRKKKTKEGGPLIYLSKYDTFWSFSTYFSMKALSSIVRDTDARVYYCTSYWFLTYKRDQLAIGEFDIIGNVRYVLLTQMQSKRPNKCKSW